MPDSADEGITTSFARVDDSAEPERLIRLLDAQRRRAPVREWKERSFELMGVVAGGSYLDAGCGPGADALQLAVLAGPSGRVVGVDASAAMIAEARARASETNLGNLEFKVSNLLDLELPSGSFDGIRSEHVLLYLEDAAAALAEMYRVCVPGGRIVCSEPDSATWLTDSPFPDLHRRIVDFMCRHIPNPLIGRQLRRLFIEAGLEDVTVEPRCNVITSYEEGVNLIEIVRTLERPLKAGVVGPEEAHAWLESLREAGHQGTFLWSMTYFMVHGTKPD